MIRLLVAVLMASATGLVLQAQSQPSAARTHLDGKWQLEDPIVPENPKNWQRTRQTTSTTGAGGGRGGATGLNIPGVFTLQTFGTSLIAESFKLSIAAGPQAITIGDDFFNPTSFTMSWRGHRLAVPTGRTKLGQHYATVVVKTRWQGDALVQDLSGTYGGEFKTKRVFKLAEDGRRLLMLIHVEKPKMTPPVADITRAYVPATSQTPAPR